MGVARRPGSEDWAGVGKGGGPGLGLGQLLPQSVHIYPQSLPQPDPPCWPHRQPAHSYPLHARIAIHTCVTPPYALMAMHTCAALGPPCQLTTRIITMALSTRSRMI